MTSYASFIEQITKHHIKQLPFVVYALPNDKEMTAQLQKDDVLYDTEDFKEASFIFSSFQFSDKVSCIPIEKCEILSCDDQPSTSKIVPVQYVENHSLKEKHKALVSLAIKSISQRKMQKIVISRQEKIAISNFSLETIYDRLFSIYPTAFRYIWYHPKTGLWCGASPELFVKTNGISFTTMALAGTKKYYENEKPKWSYKEINEQQIVVDQIVEHLQKKTATLKVSSARNHQAGALVHILSDITGIIKKGRTSLFSICKALHPTPAVCGTPQKEAKNFILKNEDYNREFYTGFLGPICKKNNCSHLFVNLRCMKIEDNLATIFVGGGITFESNPEDEWNETVNKIQTMLQVLKPLLSK